MTSKKYWRARFAIRLAATFLLTTTFAYAEISIRSLTGVIEGHEVGGVAIDMIGNVYAADFGDVVWKVTPEGVRTEYAAGMYGTAGNAVDMQGYLLQSSFYGDSISRIDRMGKVEPFVTDGLSRPVGIAVDRRTGEVYVANCRGNSIVKVDRDGKVAVFANSELFNCPYGLAFDRDGNLYTVNFQDPRMLKIDRKGAVSAFATLSDKGLGYLCFKNDRFYVTAFWSHQIYEVKLDGAARRILGTGERAVVDGTAAQARLSFPAGIACHPWAPRLYVNEDVNESGTVVPRRSIIRVIHLE
jgi:DNA-binding beta-propeller fold protein YncE